MFAYSKLTYIYFGSLRRLQFLTSRLTINWALSSKLQSEQADFGSRKPRLVNQGQEKAYESIVHISSSIFISLFYIFLIAKSRIRLEKTGTAGICLNPTSTSKSCEMNLEVSNQSK